MTKKPSLIRVEAYFDNSMIMKCFKVVSVSTSELKNVVAKHLPKILPAEL